MNRIKRYTDQVFADNKAKFGLDFAENKSELEKLATIRSKELKNEIAGFITRTIRKEKKDADERRRRADADLELEQGSSDLPKEEDVAELDSAMLDNDSSN